MLSEDDPRRPKSGIDMLQKIKEQHENTLMAMKRLRCLSPKEWWGNGGKIARRPTTCWNRSIVELGLLIRCGCPTRKWHRVQVLLLIADSEASQRKKEKKKKGHRWNLPTKGSLWTRNYTESWKNPTLGKLVEGCERRVKQAPPGVGRQKWRTVGSGKGFFRGVSPPSNATGQIHRNPATTARNQNLKKSAMHWDKHETHQFLPRAVS